MPNKTQPRKLELHEFIARKIFELGDEPYSSCNRIQFKGGLWPDNERNQGGCGEAPLARHIKEAIKEFYIQG